MEFKLAYLNAFRKADPRGFNQLTRSGKMDAHLQEVGMQAHQHLQEMLATAPRDSQGNPTMAALREAEERVVAMMTEFPPRPVDQTPEMPDDLPNQDQSPRHRRPSR